MTRRPAVLLVEDNPITRKLVRFALQQEEIDLTEAIDGKTALEAAGAEAARSDPAGFAAARHGWLRLAAACRQLPQLRSVPILAFSGLLSQLDEKRIAGSSFTDFVTKPIEPSRSWCA